MSGRRLLPLLFFSLLSSGVLGAIDKKFYPLHLLPIVSPNGLTTQVGDCIGALVTDEHILAAKSCLTLPGGKEATGVFADYRLEKNYPADPDLYPVSEYLFSKNITLDPANDFAVITLHVPFKDPSNSIDHVYVGKGGKVSTTISFKREGPIVNVSHEAGNNYAGYDSLGKLVSLNGKDIAPACGFLDSTTGGKAYCS